MIFKPAAYFGREMPVDGFRRRFGAEPPTPAAPANLVVTTTGSGRVGETLGFLLSYGTQPSPPPTRSPQWLKDGTPIDGATSETYVPTADDEGSLISPSVYVENTEGFTSATGSGKLITFAPPTFIQLPSVSPGSGNTGDIFTVLFELGGLGLTVDLQWLVSGVEREGETSATYQATPEDGTAAITCRVTGSNSGGTVQATTNPAANVTYVEAPSLTGWTLTPNTGVEAGDAIVAQGNVHGVPTPELDFEWTDDTVTIPGEDTATLVAPEGAVRCIVTATNSEGSAQVTLGPVNVAGITPGGPTIDLSGVNPIGYAVDGGVQTLDLSALSTGDNRVYSAIKVNGLTALAALVVQEGVGGTRDGSAAFPYAESPAGFSYALTGPAATFDNSTDPREGITDADLPAGISINATSGLATVSAAAADLTATNYTVWKYNQAVVASQTLSITITDTAVEVWDLTGGAEKITVNDMPAAPAAPTATGGVEKITITG